MSHPGPIRRITAGHRVLRSLMIIAIVVALFYLVPPQNRVGGDGGVFFALIVMAAAFTLYGLSMRRRFREYKLTGNWQASGLEALGLGILLTAVLFASLYFALAATPGQIDGIQTKTDALYFSVTTLATVGYGDIHPVGQVTRIVATFQMLFDLVFIATGTGFVVSSLFTRAQNHAATLRAQQTNGDASNPPAQ